MLIRFILYGLGGWCGEILFTATRDRLRGRVHDWKLKGTTYLWMFPLYGSIVFLYEPVHDAVRSWPWFVRGAVYMIGFFTADCSCLIKDNLPGADMLFTNDWENPAPALVNKILDENPSLQHR